MSRLERLAKIIAEHGPEEQIRTYMKTEGFDPDKGCVLILPAALRCAFFWPFGPPKFVKFSAILTDRAVMIADPLPGRIQPP